MNNPEEQNWASSSNFAPQQIVSIDFEHLRPQIVSILSETANGCITELGYHPNVINDLSQQIASLEREKEDLLSQLENKDSDNARLFADNRQLFISRDEFQRLALNLQLARDNEQRLAKENVAKTEYIRTLQDALISHNINIEYQQLAHRYSELLEISNQLHADKDQMRAERDFLLAQRRPTLKSVPGPHPPAPRGGVEPSFDASSPNPMRSSQQQPQQHYLSGHNLNSSHNSLSNAIPTPAQMHIQHQQPQRHALPQGHPQQVQHPMTQRRSSGNYAHSSPPQQQQSYVPSHPSPASQSSSRRSSMHIPSQALPQHRHILPHVQRPDSQQMHPQQPHSRTPYPQQQQQAYPQQQSPQQQPHLQQPQQASPQQQQAPPSLRITTQSRMSQQIPLTPPLSSLHNGPFYTLSPTAQSSFPPPPFNPPIVPQPSAPSEHSLAAPPPTPPISHKSMTPEVSMDQKPIADMAPTAGSSSLKRELESDPSECQETKRPKLEEPDQQMIECVDDNKEEPSEPEKRTVWECITDGLEATGTGDDTICRLCVARAEKFSDEPMPMPFVDSIQEEITAHFEEHHAYILQRYRLGTL